MNETVVKGDKYQDLMRDLRKVGGNKKCINCGERNPPNVVFGYYIFVCMTCSGIHREFTHKVKSISMHSFTKDEYAAFKKGGNDIAKSTYLAKWRSADFTAPQPNDETRIREFIRMIYIEKRWYKEPDSDDEVPAAPAVAKKSSDLSASFSRASSAFPAPSASFDDDVFGSAAPKSISAPPPPPAKAPADAFGFDFSAPEPAKAKPVDNGSFDMTSWSAPPPPPPRAEPDAFGASFGFAAPTNPRAGNPSFSSPAPAPPPPPPAAPKDDPFASVIAEQERRDAFQMKQTQVALQEARFEQQLQHNPFAAYTPPVPSPTPFGAETASQSAFNPFLVDEPQSGATDNPFLNAPPAVDSHNPFLAPVAATTSFAASYAPVAAAPEPAFVPGPYSQTFNAMTFPPSPAVPQMYAAPAPAPAAPAPVPAPAPAPVPMPAATFENDPFAQFVPELNSMHAAQSVPAAAPQPNGSDFGGPAGHFSTQFTAPVQQQAVQQNMPQQQFQPQFATFPTFPEPQMQQYSLQPVQPVQPQPQMQQYPAYAASFNQPPMQAQTMPQNMPQTMPQTMPQSFPEQQFAYQQYPTQFQQPSMSQAYPSQPSTYMASNVPTNANWTGVPQQMGMAGGYDQNYMQSSVQQLAPPANAQPPPPPQRNLSDADQSLAAIAEGTVSAKSSLADKKSDDPLAIPDAWKSWMSPPKAKPSDAERTQQQQLQEQQLQQQQMQQQLQTASVYGLPSAMPMAPNYYAGGYPNAMMNNTGVYDVNQQMMYQQQMMYAMQGMNNFGFQQ